MASKILDNTEFLCTIERLAKGGFGICHHQGKTFFVENALPDESGIAQTTQEKSHFGFARFIDRQVLSPLRIDDTCPCAPHCDGCGFRHVAFQHALELKARAVYDEIVKNAKIQLPAPVLCPISSPDGHRRRIRLHLTTEGIGFFARHTHQRISAAQCPAISPNLRLAVQQLEALCPPRLCAQIGGPMDIQLDLDDRGFAFAHFKKIQPRILKRQKHRPNQRPNPASPNYHLTPLLKIARANFQTPPFAGFRIEDECFGQPMIRDIVQNDAVPPIITWRRIGDFAQATAEANAHIHRITADFMAQTKAMHVADLFAGSGNLSFRAACYAPKVDSFEQFCGHQAFERGLKDNRGAIRPDAHVALHLCDLSRGLPDAARHAQAAICDPARDGMSAKLCQELCQCSIKDILYVSCEASCLARDLTVLSSAFSVTHIYFVDMFPQTPHVETVVLMSRVKDK